MAYFEGTQVDLSSVKFLIENYHPRISMRVWGRGGNLGVLSLNKISLSEFSL